MTDISKTPMAEKSLLREFTGGLAISLTAIALVLATPTMGNADDTTNQQEMQMTYQDKSKFEKWLEARQDDLKQSWAETKDAYRDLKGDAKDQWIETSIEVEKLEDRLEDKTEALADATEETWDDVKADVVAAMEDLEQAIDDLSEDKKDG